MSTGHVGVIQLDPTERQISFVVNVKFFLFGALFKLFFDLIPNGHRDKIGETEASPRLYHGLNSFPFGLRE